MASLNGTLRSAIVLFVFFSLVSGFFSQNTFAQTLPIGPAWVNGNPVLGQNLTLYASFRSPSSTITAQYMLDTEVYSAASGAGVAQFYEVVQLSSNQAVTRSYTWKTQGLIAGSYIFKQGIFTPNWSYCYGWNNGSGSTTLRSKISTTPAPTPTFTLVPTATPNPTLAPTATPTPTPSPTPTATPTATSTATPTATPTPPPTATPPQVGTWQTSARLTVTQPVVNSTIPLEGTFEVPVSGNYILNMELNDSTGTRLGQYNETRALTLGVSQIMVWNWLATTSGSITLKMGIFNTSWQMQSWNNNALTFIVNDGIATPTATPGPTPSTTPAPTVSGYLRGVNLAGAEFGADKIPGVYNVDYTYPDSSNLDYYNSKGLNLVRLPFLWERLQPTLNGALDPAELGRIDGVVAAAKARGMQIILDPHNYDRYRLNGTLYLIGSSQVPTGAFKDFWTKLATHYRNETTIYAFGLMNEPHDTNGTWPTTAQAGLDGIRSADTTHLVLVPGDGWSGAWTWQQNNVNLLLNDPANKLLYEAHQYFDRDGSGTYSESYDAGGAYPMIGADRVQAFIDWLKTNGVRGIITEYGVPDDDPRWQIVLDNFLYKLDAAGIGGTYWAGGPWWGDYALSCEPANGVDKPVISTLVKHLNQV